MATPYSGFKLRRRRPGSARKLLADLPEGPRRRIAQAQASVAETFKGITTGGNILPGLFTLQKTGVETGSIKTAAENFIGSLSPDARKKVLFDIDSNAWRQ
ncbi:MAG: hypothetical protein GTO40_29565 [Deltaproteobacteria bacterium]|nr:hypothetical protein [Deltaproteobacteria bacterium]